jgi:oligopeptide transport system substrate-binding protein
MDDFYAARAEGEVDVVVQRWLADYPDADSFAYGVLHSEAGAVGRFCGSPEIDALIARAPAEVDPARRHATYREIEHIVARDVLLVPLFHEQVYRIPRPELRGLRVSISSPPVAYEELWLER